MKVCASLSAASDLNLSRNADMVEIRTDLLDTVPDTGGVETIVTYRGDVDLGILPEGFSGLIDIGENERPDTDLTVIGSYHDYESTPGSGKIAALLNSMDADIRKGAFKVNSLRDLISIADAADSVNGKHVLLGMGPLGTVTRIRQSVLDNEFSFGYVGEPTAPGQLSVDEMTALGDDCMILGILGYPLNKSRSPDMQNAALRENGVNGIYLKFEADCIDQIEEVIRIYNIRGMNVTIPYKTSVMDHIDRVDRDASAVGAVNTIVNDGGILTGYNTDLNGIDAALKLSGFDAEDRRILIMGSGGAARACTYYMDKHNADVTITGRNKETGEELAKEFNASFRSPTSISVKMYDLVVNCTPVGMYSDGPYPINISAITKEQTVFDMVYSETPLMREAMAKGCKVARGSDMLAGQGAESFRLWTGYDNAFDVMRRQLE